MITCFYAGYTKTNNLMQPIMSFEYEKVTENKHLVKKKIKFSEALPSLIHSIIFDTIVLYNNKVYLETDK